MNNKEIKFDTSVVVTFLPDFINLSDSSGVNKIIRNEDLGTFSYNLFYLKTKGPFAIAVVLFFAGIFAAIVLKDPVSSIFVWLGLSLFF